MAPRAAVVALLLVSLRAGATPPVDAGATTPGDLGAARFGAAIALEARDLRGAADALEALAREQPDGALAADALAEAAELCETRLFDPARALVDWTQVARRYPASRVAHRASLRQAELERALAIAPAAALGALDHAIAEAGDPPRPEACAAVARLVETTPALAERGGYWLAQAAELAGQTDEALRRYDEVLRRGGAFASRAARGKAELLLRRGRLSEASAAYDALAKNVDPLSRAALVEGRARLASARLLRALGVGAWAILAAFVVGCAARGWRWLWPPPAEVRYLGPVAVLFSLAALGAPGAIARAITIIAAGGVAVSWLSGASYLAARQRRSEAPPFSTRLARATAAAVAMLALAFLAIRGNDLVTTVLETLRNGPD